MVNNFRLFPPIRGILVEAFRSFALLRMTIRFPLREGARGMLTPHGLISSTKSKANGTSPYPLHKGDFFFRI